MSPKRPTHDMVPAGVESAGHSRNPFNGLKFCSSRETSRERCSPPAAAYYRAAVARPYLPAKLVLENTSICNLTCIHCSHRELQRTRRHMKRELWNKIVEEFGANSPDTEI